MRNHQRDVTIALCSIAVGIMLAAGTFFTRETSLSASTLDGLFAMRWEDAASHGVVDQADVLRRPEATSFTRPSASTSVSSIAPSVVPIVTSVDIPAVECGVATDVAASFAAAIERHIPRDFEFKTIREGLQFAVDKALHGYCVASPSSSSASSQSPVQAVNNQCDQYGVFTARYASCKVEEREGRPYPIPSKQSRI